MADEDDSPTGLRRSLSARLRRKEQVARGEAVPDMPEDVQPPGAADQEAEPDEEAALSDEELLAKYGVEDPEAIEDEDKLDSLLQGQFPDRIRQMALRRMWRLNPLFRFADEMVEYGENYTDAATVIDGMQTAYQVGKGYLQKAFDAVKDDDVEDDDVEGDGDDMAGAETSSAEAPEAEAPEAEAPEAEAPEAASKPAEQQETALSGGAPRDAATEEHRDAAKAPASAHDVGQTVDPVLIEVESEPAPPPRPSRMTFRKPA